MKKIIYSFLITCFLFACSDNTGLIPDVNDSKPLEEGELIPVTFNVERFSKEESPFRASSSSNFSLKYLEHYIFNVTTGFLYRKYNKIEDSDGSIDCELPEGEYISVFVAYNSGFFGLLEHNILSTISPPFFHVKEENSPLNSLLVDHFYKKIHYEVKKGEANSNQVILERIVGKVEIVLTDIIPSYTKEIRLTAHGVGTGNFHFSVDTEYAAGQILDIRYPITEGDRISTGFTMSFFVYENNSDPEDCYIDLDTSNDQTAPPNTGTSTKRIDNLVVQKNKIVRYSGNLFDEDVYFSVRPIIIDDEWGETTEIPY